MMLLRFHCKIIVEHVETVYMQLVVVDVHLDGVWGVSVLIGDTFVDMLIWILIELVNHEGRLTEDVVGCV